jgi:low affinity Fe/Cu permease
MNGKQQGEENPTWRERFRRFAQVVSQFVGSPWMFLLACIVIVAWAATGPFFQYSDTWQLVINTGTTIVTFLMVFLIQNTQNRDSRAIHLKLDELIRALKGARNKLVNLEEMSDEELDKLQTEFQRVCGSRNSKKGQSAEKRQQEKEKEDTAETTLVNSDRLPPTDAGQSERARARMLRDTN